MRNDSRLRRIATIIGCQTCSSLHNRRATTSQLNHRSIAHFTTAESCCSHLRFQRVRRRMIKHHDRGHYRLGGCIRREPEPISFQPAGVMSRNSALMRKCSSLIELTGKKRQKDMNRRSPSSHRRSEKLGVISFIAPPPSFNFCSYVNIQSLVCRRNIRFTSLITKSGVLHLIHHVCKRDSPANINDT
jgi:hypothetical protein